MAWKDTLLEASYRGVKFDVVGESSKHGHAQSSHEYPYVDGANIETMGRRPRHFSFEAIFYGDDYESRLQAFQKALETAGAGELIHPVYGSIKQAVVADWEWAHKAEEVDQASLRVEFVESITARPFFDRSVPLAKAAKVDAATAKVRDFGLLAFTKRITDLRALIRTPAELAAFAGVFDGAMSVLRLSVSGVLTSGLSILAMPSAWIGDVRSIVGLVRNFSPLSALSSTFNAVLALGSFLGLSRLFTSLTDAAVPAVATVIPGVSNAPGSPYAEARELAAQQLRVEALAELADTAADVLSQESLTPVMSPAEIEALANEVRARAQAAVDWYRAHLDLESAHAVSEAVKETAWAVQDLAKSVIELRPPIIARAAEGPACLRLLAHQWYGDHERAIELARLNPRLRLPNFIEQGQTLNAYAE
jgi:prophage DNA circulation protein